MAKIQQRVNNKKHSFHSNFHEIFFSIR
jgi:hypothetical protein